MSYLLILRDIEYELLAQELDRHEGHQQGCKLGLYRLCKTWKWKSYNISSEGITGRIYLLHMT